MTARQLSAFFAGGTLCIAAAAHATDRAAPQPEGLPAPDLPASIQSAPSPQFDAGLVLGGCAVASGPGVGGEFCAAVLAEMLLGRRRPEHFALGPYVEVGTSGFKDSRSALGLVLHAPLGALLSANLRGAPLLYTSSWGTSWGMQAYAELGIRTLSYQTPYSMDYGLVLGLSHVPGSDPRAGTTYWLALRVDAFWLALPFLLLF